MVFITGDTHSHWVQRLSSKNFPEGKELTNDDYVIICGDFGLWHDTPEERYNLEWLSNKPWVTVFVDGNHENFDRLYRDFKIVKFHGAEAHEIRDNIFHIKRGEVMTLNGKNFFCFGGAHSHDISAGILNPEQDENWKQKAKELNKKCLSYRVKGLSWWPEEFPTVNEMLHGYDKLFEAKYDIDYIISHDAPSLFKLYLGYFPKELDDLNIYLQQVMGKCPEKTKLYCGHYHENVSYCSCNCLYEKIERVI